MNSKETGTERFKAEAESWQQRLNELELDSNNSVVIGSGIMQALGLRQSRDLDLVVPRDAYQRLSSRDDLTADQANGHPVLAGDKLEVFWFWKAIGGERDFDYLKRRSVVIDAIRYISLEFLLDVKEGWVVAGEDRPKDHGDIRLIRNHLGLEE